MNSTVPKSVLAIDGGSPALPPERRQAAPWPAYDRAQTDAVVEVLHSGRVNYWTGDRGRRFEAALARYHGLAHGVALSNGTQALELALRALGVQAGDQVIVPVRTFIGTATAVASVGALPYFVDVDPDTGLMDARNLPAKVDRAIKAVVPVHLDGNACDMTEICVFAEEAGIALVEDCAQAHGARFESRLVGTFGAIGCFSFCQDKILTTGGEGGACVTDDVSYFQALWSGKDHGKDHELAHQRGDGTFRWIHSHPGTNARMTEMQAAIGLLQLAQLDEWLAIRRRNADHIAENLPEGLSPISAPGHQQPARYRFPVTVEPGRMRRGWTRDRLLRTLLAEGVGIRAGVCPCLPREQVFRKHPQAKDAFPGADRFGARCLSFDVHPTMTVDYVDQVVEAVHKVAAHAFE